MTENRKYCTTESSETSTRDNVLRVPLVEPRSFSFFYPPLFLSTHLPIIPTTFAASLPPLFPLFARRIISRIEIFCQPLRNDLPFHQLITNSNVTDANKLCAINIWLQAKTQFRHRVNYFGSAIDYSLVL